MRKKWVFVLDIFLIALLLVSALALGGCDTAAPPVDGGDENGTPDPAPDPDPAPELKTLIVGLEQIPPTFDPWNHRNLYAQTVIQAFTDPLVELLPDGGLVLSLAESITWLDDVTAEIKLRQDILFHNGDPMTADDVVFSVRRMGDGGGMDGETSPRLHSVGGPMYNSIEKVDDYTVQVNFNPGSWSPNNWNNYEVFPKTYFEEVGGIKGFMEKPIGCGPFKWVEGDLSSYVVLERFEDYWGGPDLPGDAERVPAVDRIIFQFIPETTTRVAALLAGDVDIIQGVPSDFVPMLEADPNVNLVSTPSTRLVELNFNVNKAPFDDKRVRQAVAYAIDIDLIIQELLGGYADALYGQPYLPPYPEGSGVPGFQPDYVQHLIYEYNPEKAMALLEEAGVSGFSCVLDTFAGHVEEAQAIAQMLNDVGIDCSVRVWEAAVLREVFLSTGRDMFLNNRGQGARSPEGYRNVAGTGQAGNNTGYSNPVYDGLIREALARTEHDDERKALFMQAYEIIMDDLPSYWMHNFHIIEATRANVKNFWPSVRNRPNFHRVDIE